MNTVLGREVVERQQLLDVVADLGYRLRKLRTIGRLELLDRVAGVGLVLGVPDLCERLLAPRVRRLRQRGKNIRYLVERATLLAGLREHLAQRATESERPVPGGRAGARMPRRRQSRSESGPRPQPGGDRSLQLLAAVERTPIITSRHSFWSSRRTLTWMPSAHRYTKSTPDKSRSANACCSAFHVSVSLVIVEADSPFALPKYPEGGHEISRREPVQVQQRQHRADLRGLARPRRQDRRREPLPLAGPGSTRLSLTRGAVTSTAPHSWSRSATRGSRCAPPADDPSRHERQRTGRCKPRPPPAGPRPASAAHPLGRSRRLPTTRPSRAAPEPSRSAESETTVSMGRTFPTSVVAPVLLGTFHRSPGKVRPIPSRSTDFKMG